MRTSALLATGLALAAFATTGCSVLGGEDPADLQVYTGRHYGSEKVFEKFTKDTGITVDILSGDDADLLERIKAEGAKSTADIFMTVSAGPLWNAADQGLLESLDSTVLDKAVPAQYRDADDRWFGLVRRARTVVYDPAKVDPKEFDAKDTYAGLTDPKWKGRLCMRDLSGAYTTSLVASLINLHGYDKTLAMVKGWLANDVEIMGNDVELLEAISAGTCEVGISNHYYLARGQADGELKDVALYWASQQGAGVHENISGAGVVATSDAKAKAQEFLEWLATEGQDDMLEGNHEFPVNPEVPADEAALAFGPFKAMSVDAEAYGQLNPDAVKLLAEADYK
ncbi:extracellular solute-binding protein [Nocardioides cavernaquae]|uniref:Extracellular solute-binding protein n=1 Tax=Nocardioides cavernaquae TaxID=2321396 RepID=A0A3A5H8V0_9ACTN|nr:extracellular solute-binding protein [Nocardioides cavernaquae]RJS46842.1 extracellular solute-binding protein [Nocardioides cavernaquae]